MANVDLNIRGNFGQVETGVRNLTSLLKELGFTAKDIKRTGLGDLGAKEAEKLVATLNANLADVKKNMQGASGERLKKLNPADFNEFVAQLHNRKIFPSGRMPRRYVQDVLGGATVGTQAEDLVRGGAEEEGAGARSGRLLGGTTRMSGFGMLKRFTGIGLGLAGIGGIVGTLGAAISGAQTEAIGLDTLMRSLKDTGDSFDAFRSQIEQSTKGLALTYQESVGLAQNFAHLSGISSQLGVVRGAREAEGFARGYGIEPGVADQIYGRGALLGTGTYSPEKLSKIFADAITASGMQSRAADVMQQIMQYMANSERFAPQAPNIRGFADLYAALNQEGQKDKLPGLVGPNAAAVINTMDQSLRAGGSAGPAGLNFLYMALNREKGGKELDPYQVTMLMQSGLFATRASALNMKGPGTNVTNYQAVRDLMDRMFGKDTEREWMSFGNLMGLSMPMAKAVIENTPVSSAQRIGKFLSATGIDLHHINPTGYKELEEISTTPNTFAGMRSLSNLREQYLGKPGLGAQDKQRLESAHTYSQLRDALAHVAASEGRRFTTGYETASSIADLKNTITTIGGKIIDPLNDIRNVIDATLGKFVKASDILGSSLSAAGRKDPYVTPWFKSMFGIDAGLLSAFMGNYKGANGWFNYALSGAPASGVSTVSPSAQAPWNKEIKGLPRTKNPPDQVGMNLNNLFIHVVHNGQTHTIRPGEKHTVSVPSGTSSTHLTMDNPPQ